MDTEKITCENCEYCKIIHDEDLFTKAKCMATSKKGKQMAYHATYCFYFDENGNKVMRDPILYLQSYIQRRMAPAWCPKRKGKVIK